MRIKCRSPVTVLYYIRNSHFLIYIDLYLTVCNFFAVEASPCTFAKPLSVFPLKSLTIKQHSDNGLIVEIKISLLPSIKWVVNRRCGGWKELR